MAIGALSSGSAYTIGGKPLGVQLGGKSAADIFGGGGAESIFAANVTASAGGISVDSTQMIVKGIQDEIDRTLGYRTNLSVAEKQKLADLQTQIGKYNEVAQTRSLTSDEISERGELYVDAYRILGKDYVDVAADEFLTSKTEEMTELMTTVPKGAEAERLRILESMRQNMIDRIDQGTESTAEIYFNPLRNIMRQIQALTPPREITDLSPDELRQHDEIADAINDYAGQELQLRSDKRLKIARLQLTMQMVSDGGGRVNTII